MPAIRLDDIHTSGWRIDANVHTALTEVLDDARYARLLRLLEVPVRQSASRDVISTGGNRLTLEYHVRDRDAQLTASNPMSLSSIVQIEPLVTIRMEISAPPNVRQQVQSITLTDDEGNATALPAHAVYFDIPGLPSSALVPRDIWTEAGVDRALTAPVRQGFASTYDPDGTRKVSFRAITAEERRVSVRLAADPVLGGWRVKRVDVIGPLRLQPQCRDWLQGGSMQDQLEGPQFPRVLVDTVQQVLARHERGEPVAEGTFVRDPDATGSSDKSYAYVECNGLVPLEGNGHERWQVRVTFVPYDGGWKAAAARFNHPRLPQNFDYVLKFRPSTQEWPNPLQPDEDRLQSLPTSASRRDAEDADLSPPPQSQTASRTRREEQTLNENATAQTLTPPGLQPPVATAGQVASIHPLFQTQQEYRILQGPGYENAAVCPALAVGIALHRYIPFGELLAVNPRAHTGTSVQETWRLLQRHGVVAHCAHFFQATNGGIPTAQLGAHMQTLLDGRTFDSAVLIYRTGGGNEVPADRIDVPHHHVALFHDGTQWWLHDGMAQAWPWPVNGQQAAAHTYGARNDDGYGEVEMLAFMRPPSAVQAPFNVPVAAPAPGQQQAAAGASVGPGTIAQDNGELVRGRQMDVPSRFARTVWNSIVGSLDDTGLSVAMAQHRAGLSRTQKFEIVLAACAMHNGVISPDAYHTVRAPAYRYEGVPVLGVPLNVCVRFSHVGDEGPLVVSGMQIYTAGAQRPHVRWRATSDNRFPFAIAHGAAATNLATSGGRLQALQNRGIYERWDTATQGRTRRAQISTAIVRACAQAVKAGPTQARTVDPAHAIDCVRINFHGEYDDFYLRFTNASRVEVCDVRVRDRYLLDDATQTFADESEESVIQKMLEGIEHGRARVRDNMHGRSVSRWHSTGPAD